MTRVLTGTDVLGVTLDTTIGATKPDDVRTAIMRDSLLYGCLVVQSTAVLWTNDGFRRVVTKSDGAELLRHGIIVPLIEDNVASFAASLERAQVRHMANLNPLADRAYADFLERESSGGATFPATQVADRYRRTFALTNVVEHLVNFGISYETAERYLALVQTIKPTTGSEVWDKILPQLPANERALVWQCERLPYITSVPLALHIGIACPEGFEGDRLLTSLARHDHSLPSLTVAPINARSGRFRIEINEAAINWLLSTETLGRMTTEDLLTARAIPSRATYLESLQRHFATNDEASWNALKAPLELYLREAALTVFRRFVADGRIDTGPQDNADPVLVTGDGALNITVPHEKTLHLIGASDTSGIQIIGRPLSLPNDNDR